MQDHPKLRLYVDAPLAAGERVALASGQAHYLLNVMRAARGTSVALFNGRDGEWRAVIEDAGKKAASLAVETRLKAQTAEPDLWLLFAPVKRNRLDFIVEKATELGVSALHPVFTRQTAMSRVNDGRLAAIAIEAAEQCRRLTVPALASPQKLEDAIAGWEPDRLLILLDEKGNGRPIAEALAGRRLEKAALLVGPEGGFTDSELDALGRLAFAVAVGLGPRILRAETAVVAALACVQALAGDWRNPPAA